MGKVSEWIWDHFEVVFSLSLISMVVCLFSLIFIYSDDSVFDQCYDLIYKKEIYGSWNSTEKDYMYENCTRYL